MTSLVAAPLTLREANAFVKRHHRHHGPVRGQKLAIGAMWEGELIAVAILGRPVSRMRDDGRKLETLRLCTDGVKRPLGRENRRGEPMFVNAASFLHGRARKVAAAMGCSLGTYILESEHGISLIAAGYRYVRRTAGGSWDVPSRRRIDKHPTEPKLLFEAATP